MDKNQECVMSGLSSKRVQNSLNREGRQLTDYLQERVQHWLMGQRKKYEMLSDQMNSQTR